MRCRSRKNIRTLKNQKTTKKQTTPKKPKNNKKTKGARHRPKSTPATKANHTTDIHVVVYNVKYADDIEGKILLEKRNSFVPKYGTYVIAQSGVSGWCDTYRITSSHATLFRKEYRDYWNSQHIHGLRVEVHPKMSRLGHYLDDMTVNQ